MVEPVSRAALRQGGVAGTVDGRGATGHSGASCTTVSPSGSAESATYSVGKFEGRSSASTTYGIIRGLPEVQSSEPVPFAGCWSCECGSSSRSARGILGNCVQSSDHPEEVSQVLEKLTFEDLNSQTLGPGQLPIGLNARAWVEFRSKIGNYNKTSAHASWGAAGVLAMEPWSRQSCRWRAFLPSVLWRCINHLQWQTASSRSAASYIDPEVCRDIAGVPEGPGRLPGKKKECREVQCAEDQGWRWKRGSRSQKDGQSEGQVQRGRPKLAASRISFRPYSGRWESDS